MKDVLGSLVRQKRKVEQKVNSANKNQIINQMNKYVKTLEEGELPKISKNASVKDVERYRKNFLERISYDIVVQAVKEGNSIIAEIESRDLKKSDDMETKRLGEFGKQLAQAKKQSSKNLTKEQKAFLERGNNNIKGFGNEDIITLFEKTKTKAQVQKLIDEIKNQNTKNEFYDKQNEIFDNVFRKVGIVREDDINKIKELILSSDMETALSMRNTLIESLDTYGSPDNMVGAWNGEETELANARLDDMLIKFGLKKTGIQKVKKTLGKYKSTKE